MALRKFRKSLASEFETLRRVNNGASKILKPLGETSKPASKLSNSSLMLISQFQALSKNVYLRKPCGYLLILQEFSKVPKTYKTHINSRKTLVPGISTNIWLN